MLGNPRIGAKFSRLANQSIARCMGLRKQRKAVSRPPMRCTESPSPITKARNDRQLCTFIGRGLRALGRYLRDLGAILDSFSRPGQCPDARNSGCHPDRCRRLPGPSVPHHCHGGRGFNCADGAVSGRSDGGRFCSGCGALRGLRLHRHERVGARQCAHCASGHPWHWSGAGRGLQGRCHHWHAGGRIGPVGRHGLLLVLGGQRATH